MVLALAGDSTITRFLAISSEELDLKNCANVNELTG
jgi:hypothetical protein